MQRVSISDGQLTPLSVWKYYETEREAVIDLKSKTIARFRDNDPSLTDSPYARLLPREVEEYFDAVLEEIDYHACLGLMAAAEAAIRADFRRRVLAKKKDAISQLFRALFKKSGRKLNKIKFNDDMLEIWASRGLGCKKAIGDFRGAWHYRNWLAHGRYWDLKTTYQPVTVLQIIQSMLPKMGIAL